MWCKMYLENKTRLVNIFFILLKEIGKLLWPSAEI